MGQAMGGDRGHANHAVNQEVFRTQLESSQSCQAITDGEGKGSSGKCVDT